MSKKRKPPRYKPRKNIQDFMEENPDLSYTAYHQRVMDWAKAMSGAAEKYPLVVLLCLLAARHGLAPGDFTMQKTQYENVFKITPNTPRVADLFYKIPPEVILNDYTGVYMETRLDSLLAATYIQAGVHALGDEDLKNTFPHVDDILVEKLVYFSDLEEFWKRTKKLTFEDIRKRWQVGEYQLLPGEETELSKLLSKFGQSTK